MKRKIALSLALVGLSIAMWLGGYYRGISVKLEPCIEYYNKTEELLDTIYCQNQEYFEALVETDVYYNYEVAKDKLNKY